MATTVLSGTSGALYYKPAGTTGSFGESNVSIGSDEITVAPYLNFKVGDPVKFSVINSQTGGSGTGTLPAGITAGTTYYVIAYAPATGVLQVSATAGGSTITITDDGTAVTPNEFQVAYADFAVVGQVRDWSFEISRAEIDVTTIGQTPGQYVPFRNYISGFGDGSGTATAYMTNEELSLSNRLIEDVLQRQQTGAAFKLYTDRVFSGGTLDDTLSRSIAFDAVITSASMNVNPDDAQSVTVNFRPAGTPTFDFATS
ncbi:MAG: hypothetical protein EBY40_02540 [Marivivens sp.]|nr:hypothetical protein [Marivivens sp.]NBT50461.1 hypothetical protein [Marivivens sp.]NCW67697.1 hypothetical protein [Marivivens sp.]NDH01989.1 hypothetical protein [Marivivens sp.]